jgi:hypothetical protein
MGIPHQTDERLRHWLDTNQLARERICQCILSLDKRFTDVRPRHPRGGPDGGRDLEAVFEGDRTAFTAVGFLNSVSDSPQERKKIAKKFDADVKAALEAQPDLKIFVFFTNVALTVGDKEPLEDGARKQGIAVIDIFDRERMRIALDSTDGLTARYQYLGIHLSDAEQAAFFARWGHQVEQLTTGSASDVRARLDRLEFIQERIRPLHNIHFGLKLSREVTINELPNFRALMAITFAPITNRIDGKLHMLVSNDHGEWQADGQTPLPGGTGQVAYAWGSRSTLLSSERSILPELNLSRCFNAHFC